MMQEEEHGSEDTRRSPLLACLLQLVASSHDALARPSITAAFSPPSPARALIIVNVSPEAAILYILTMCGKLSQWDAMTCVCILVIFHISLLRTTSSQRRFHPPSRSLSQPTETNGGVAVTPETHGCVRSLLSYPEFFVVLITWIFPGTRSTSSSQGCDDAFQIIGGYDLLRPKSCRSSGRMQKAYRDPWVRVASCADTQEHWYRGRYSSIYHRPVDNM
jgi:hypothetical protein